MVRSIPVLAVLAFTSTLCWAQSASLGDDELAVLGRVVAATHVKGGEKWFMVANDTTDFRCDDAKHMIDVGGCNGGMRSRQQKPEDVIAWLHATFPSAGPDLLADFRQKNEYPATVSRPLPIGVKQTLWGHTDKGWGRVAGEPVAKDQGAPDYLIGVSRVGFNADHSEAIAYVGAMSYKDPKLSNGEYAYARKVDGQWTVDKVARTWHLGAGSPPAK